MDYSNIILEMLNRIQTLEKEVEALKRQQAKENPDGDVLDIQPKLYNKRDTTRYMFNGNVYLKNKLVLAIVKDYISKNRTVTCSELKTVFDKSLQGSIGVVEYESVAKQRKDYQVRFFVRENEVLQLNDGNMFVCSQWGILNICNFIKRAEQLGYIIEQISRE